MYLILKIKLSPLQYNSNRKTIRQCLENILSCLITKNSKVVSVTRLKNSNNCDLPSFQFLKVCLRLDNLSNIEETISRIEKSLRQIPWLEWSEVEFEKMIFTKEEQEKQITFKLVKRVEG